MDARVRLADASEAGEVHRTMVEAFAEYAAYPTPSSALDESVDDVRAAMRRGGALLVETPAGIVGSGRFAVAWDGPPPANAVARAFGGERLSGPGGALSFERLSVVPAARGRGLAGSMIDRLEALAVALGLSRVDTAARSQQPDMRPYYLGRGYAITGYSGRYGIADLRTHLSKRLRK